MKKEVIIFVYDHFYPDFSAGGPVTSLHNLSRLLQSDCDVRIVTGAYEFRSKQLMKHVTLDSWTTWNDLPVWYASDKASISRAIDNISADTSVTLYLNGIFSLQFFLFPLQLARKKNLRVIISPRGMLQAGALRGGRVKKQLYLFFLKISGLLKGVSWHATDRQESVDIRQIEARGTIDEIPNIPVSPQQDGHALSKQAGELKLIYFSLIAEKKNLHFVLELLDQPAFSSVVLDIYGPVKDTTYWELCRERMTTMAVPGRVFYHGEISPEKSRAVLMDHHALILPTRGENFGHAIVETLAASRPVLISDQTPWRDVEHEHAGYALPLNKQIWEEKLMTMLHWTDSDFQRASSAALHYYGSKFNFDELKMRYLKLFSHHDHSRT